jgi:hypothetical protein
VTGRLRRPVNVSPTRSRSRPATHAAARAAASGWAGCVRSSGLPGVASPRGTRGPVRSWNERTGVPLGDSVRPPCDPGRPRTRCRCGRRHGGVRHRAKADVGRWETDRGRGRRTVPWPPSHGHRAAATGAGLAAIPSWPRLRPPTPALAGGHAARWPLDPACGIVVGPRDTTGHSHRRSALSLRGASGARPVIAATRPAMLRVRQGRSPRADHRRDPSGGTSAGPRCHRGPAHRRRRYDRAAGGTTEPPAVRPTCRVSPPGPSHQPVNAGHDV